MSHLYTLSVDAFLNFASSIQDLHLHRHFDDVHKDLNYSNTDLNLFSETRFSHLDDENMSKITGFVVLFRNDSQSTTVNTRPYGGTAVYSKVDFFPGYPCTVKILMAWR